MAAEAGAELTSMVFSNPYAISAAFGSVNKKLFYGWATFTYEDGSVVPGAASKGGRKRRRAGPPAAGHVAPIDSYPVREPGIEEKLRASTVDALKVARCKRGKEALHLAHLRRLSEPRQSHAA
jgi:hypothetical protein